MTDFPTLSKEANATDFTQTIASDPSIVSDFENGYQQARAKFTSVALRFEITYSFLTDDDKYILEEFEKSVSYRAGSFNWINPTDNLTYIVRFDNNLVFSKERILKNLWNVNIKFIEIRPNTSVNIS